MSRTHGLPGTYVRGCRCPDCTEAHRVRNVAVREKLAARPLKDVPHGTTSGYSSWACRCEKCTAANSGACKAYKASRRQPRVVVVVALVAMAAGSAGCLGVIEAHRHLAARTAVERPTPRPNPSPVLTSTGGAL